jgi:hypothetical protein
MNTNLDELTDEEIEAKIKELKFDLLMIKNQIVANQADRTEGLPSKGHGWISKAVTAKSFKSAELELLTKEMEKRKREKKLEKDKEKIKKIKDINYYFVEAARATMPKDVFYDLLGLAQTMAHGGE